MDLRFIEVAIGLVLVFALTSLVVSTVHEAYVSWLGRRGDNLVRALRSMLADDASAGGLLSRFQREKPPLGFTQRMLAHPLLVSQAQGEAGRNKPSYLPADLVVAALLAELSRGWAGGARPATPQTLVNAVLAAPPLTQDPDAPPPAMRSALAALVQGVESDWTAYETRLAAWFDSVAERSTGWFKRWTQLRVFLLGTLVALVFNINPMTIASRLWQDEPLRQAMVSVAQTASQAYAAQRAASQPEAAAAEAAGRTALEASAPRTARNERAQGAAALGAQAYEVDSALRKLENAIDAQSVGTAPKPDAARRLPVLLEAQIELKELVQLRRQSVVDPELPGRLLDLSHSIEQRIAMIRKEALNAQSLRGIGETAAALEKAVLTERAALLRLALPAAASARCLEAAAPDLRALCLSLEGVRRFADTGLPIGWRLENMPGCADGRCGPTASKANTDTAIERATHAQDAASAAEALVRLGAESVAERRQALLAAWSTLAGSASPPVDPAPWEVALTCLRNSRCSVGWAFAGWLLIGLASILGAPFWFDTLGRLVKLRGAGARPEDEERKPATGAPVVGGPSNAGRMLTPPTSPTPSGTAPSADSLSSSEAELSAARIRELQQALGMPADKLSGRLDTETRKAIAAWQRQNNQAPAEGVLTAEQIARLLRSTPPVAPFVAQPPQPPAAARTGTPRRADGSIAPLSEQEVRDLFGDLLTAPNANGTVTVINEGRGQAQRRLVTFQHQALARIPGGANGCKVHEKALPYFKAVFDDILAANLAGDIVDCGGTLSERHIGRDPAKPLSRHTWGIAIDLNPSQNLQGQPPAAAGQPGDLSRLVPIFEKHGFAWGGNFRQGGPDGMHFELALRAP